LVTSRSLSMLDSDEADDEEFVTTAEDDEADDGD
jgi:hypothetical protein